MNTIESPLVEIPKRTGIRAVEGYGGNVLNAYFEFTVSFPKLILADDEDLDDEGLIKAAEGVGTFKFLDAPEEDIYNESVAGLVVQK